ncbi:hypothetical protein C8Q77DRAFT_1215507 [Trametes polyzona]|nr:hypothetical protein C8Q77DRAFT_1215507 [Trametes polyzona]
MSATATMLELPRPHASSSDDSFTALMNAVLDSARSSGSLESSHTRTSTNGTSTAPSSTASSSTSTSVPSLAASGRSASSSSHSSTATSASASASASNSAASSTTPSPCPSILRSSASNLTLPSRTGSPSISFAPLPTVEPRKRNSPHPLGVAARSRLLRHRRMLREHGLSPDEVPYPYGPGSGVMGVMSDPADPAWGEEIREAEAGVDADEDARAVASRDGGHPRSRAMSDPSESDALVSLGRLVKGAGKSLWRSLSMKDVRPKDGSGGGAKDGSVAEQPIPPVQATDRRAKRASFQRKTEVHLFDHDDTPPPSAEGGVWEEEVEEESWKKLLSKPPPSSASPEPGQTDPSPSEPAESIPAKRVSTVEIVATARVR